MNQMDAEGSAVASSCSHLAAGGRGTRGGDVAPGEEGRRGAGRWDAPSGLWSVQGAGKRGGLGWPAPARSGRVRGRQRQLRAAVPQGQRRAVAALSLSPACPPPHPSMRPRQAPPPTWVGDQGADLLEHGPAQDAHEEGVADWRKEEVEEERTSVVHASGEGESSGESVAGPSAGHVAWQHGAAACRAGAAAVPHGEPAGTSGQAVPTREAVEEGGDAAVQVGQRQVALSRLRYTAGQGAGLRVCGRCPQTCSATLPAQPAACGGANARSDQRQCREPGQRAESRGWWAPACCAHLSQEVEGQGQDVCVPAGGKNGRQEACGQQGRCTTCGELAWGRCRRWAGAASSARRHCRRHCTHPPAPKLPPPLPQLQPAADSSKVPGIPPCSSSFMSSAPKLRDWQYHGQYSLLVSAVPNRAAARHVTKGHCRLAAHWLPPSALQQVRRSVCEAQLPSRHGSARSLTRRAATHSGVKVGQRPGQGADGEQHDDGQQRDDGQATPHALRGGCQAGGQAGVRCRRGRQPLLYADGLRCEPPCTAA